METRSGGIMTSVIEWCLEERNIKDLHENPNNPRRLSKHQAAHLKESLIKFGVCEPIVINPDGLIIGGHQRCKTLKGLKKKIVQVYVPNRNLNEKEIAELTIRLNKNTGDWDFDILANSWDPKDLINWGFTEDELEINIDVIEGSEPDNEVLEPPKEPRTKRGDIYILGEHRLMCGDSTAPSDVHALLNGNEPILMVTDPPYGVSYEPAWRKGIKGKKGVAARAIGKVQNDDQVNWSLAWHLFPGSIAYVWHAGKHCSDVQKSLEEAEFEIISQIIWIKQHFALSRGDYHWQHEPCWYAVKKGCEHNWQGSRKEATTWEISNLNAFGGDKEDERTAHSTQKPIECMSRPIKNNTESGEGVYDPFTGSGTTLMAAEYLERKAFCMELDPAYCDIIVSRWLRYIRKKGLYNSPILNGEEVEWKV
jgi:DNA modification methylase